MKEDQDEVRGKEGWVEDGGRWRGDEGKREEGGEEMRVKTGGGEGSGHRPRWAGWLQYCSSWVLVQSVPVLF